MSAPPRSATGTLVIADIGGYTSFLQDVAASHATDAFADGAIPPAYEMLSNLLDGIVDRLVPPFTLSKLEGDAVFVYATDGEPVPIGPALRACVDACYSEFRARLGAAHDIWSCRCDACMRIDAMDLKFIVHAGTFVAHEVAGRPELLGPEVVLAHRLLKTDAATVAGRAYLLMTAAAVQALDMPTEGAYPLVVNVEHYLPTDTYVFALRAS